MKTSSFMHGAATSRVMQKRNRRSPPKDSLPNIDAFALRRAAAEVGVDMRTIARRLRGEPVRGLAGSRADQAIAKLRATSSAPNDAPPAAGAAPR